MEIKDKITATLADIISDIARMPKGKEQETWEHIAGYLDDYLVPRLWVLAKTEEEANDTK